MHIRFGSPSNDVHHVSDRFDNDDLSSKILQELVHKLQLMLMFLF